MNRALVEQLYYQALVETGEIKGFRITNLDVAERFCELIVLECVKFVGHPTSVRVQQMKQHFGVDDGTKP